MTSGTTQRVLAHYDDLALGLARVGSPNCSRLWPMHICIEIFGCKVTDPMHGSSSLAHDSYVFLPLVFRGFSNLKMMYVICVNAI